MEFKYLKNELYCITILVLFYLVHNMHINYTTTNLLWGYFEVVSGHVTFGPALVLHN